MRRNSMSGQLSQNEQFSFIGHYRVRLDEIFRI